MFGAEPAQQLGCGIQGLLGVNGPVCLGIKAGAIHGALMEIASRSLLPSCNLSGGVQANVSMTLHASPHVATHTHAHANCIITKPAYACSHHMHQVHGSCCWVRLLLPVMSSCRPQPTASINSFINSHNGHVTSSCLYLLTVCLRKEGSAQTRDSTADRTHYSAAT